jgi:hypothetical protein
VIHSLALFEVAHFSREAATAHSRGRQPTVADQNRHPSREAAAAGAFAAVASRLKTVQLQNLRFGLVWSSKVALSN